MIRYDQKPYSPHIVDRAVEIWKRALANPVYQTTTPLDGEVHFAHMCLNMLSKSALGTRTPEVLDRFGQALKEIINTPNEHGSYVFSLDVDYEPCVELVQAALASGLGMRFPPKTEMCLYPDRLSFSMGYANPRYFHYPLSDNRWMVTSLRGTEKDQQALKAFIEQHGPTPFATIEVAA